MRMVKPSNAGVHATRQLGLEVRVEIVVREMREIRPVRADLARRAHRLRDAEVRRMLRAEERVDHEHLRTAKVSSAAGGIVFASVTYASGPMRYA